MTDTSKVGEVLGGLDEIERVMKNPAFEAELNRRHLNLSLGLLMLDGLRAYLRGDIDGALSALGTSNEEVGARHQTGRYIKSTN
jgi:hypothetical protein